MGKRPAKLQILSKQIRVIKECCVRGVVMLLIQGGEQASKIILGPLCLKYLGWVGANRTSTLVCQIAEQDILREQDGNFLEKVKRAEPNKGAG